MRFALDQLRNDPLLRRHTVLMTLITAVALPIVIAIEPTVLAVWLTGVGVAVFVGGPLGYIRIKRDQQAAQRGEPPPA